MPVLILNMNGDGAFPDLAGKPFVHLANDAKPITVAVLSDGMTSGRPSIAMRFELPDGQTVVAETSARLFVLAARAIMAKYPDVLED